MFAIGDGEPKKHGILLLVCGSFLLYLPSSYYHSFGDSVDAIARQLDGYVISIHSLEPSAMRFIDTFVHTFPFGGDIGLFSTQNKQLQ